MAGQDSLALVPSPPAGATAEACPAPAELPPFREIYQRYFEFVWSSARHLGTSPESIDDVVQEVFIVIHAKLHTIQRPESLRSWIYGVVRRTVSTHRRSHNSKETNSVQLDTLDQIALSGNTPLDAAEQSAQLQVLSALLTQMDAPKREVFILSELEEMTVPEIADALEIPVNTAYSRLRAARQAFEAGLARRAARQTEKGLR
jgi:RNA polymerase sigma-70 factor (ECF subfamily)